MTSFSIIYLISVLCLFGVVGVVLLLSEWFASTKNSTKISFKKFKQFHNINPDRWFLKDNTVIYHFNNKNNHFHFNLVDFYRYLFWHKRIERTETRTRKNDLDVEALSLLISGVTSDIEKLKNKGIKEIKEAKQSILTARKTII